MSDERVGVEDDAGVRLITFDRPEVANAFDAAMYRAVTEALVASLADDRVGAVVMTGRGQVFTGGQDLREMAALATGETSGDQGAGFRGLLDVLVAFDKPVLAAVNGVGVGLGCTLLGHVDVVLMDERARLRAPFAELGVPPEAASSWLLPERMGWQPAAALLLAAEWIDADQAVACGLALRTCPTGTVVGETLTLARRIAAFPRHATRQIKRLMMDGRRGPVIAARQREEAAFAALFADPHINPGSQLTAGLDG